MSLLDALRSIHLPPSHVPTINEMADLLGSLAAYAEHGEKLLEAADKDRKAIDAGEPAVAIDNLLSPPPEESAPAPAAPVAASPPPASPLGSAADPAPLAGAVPDPALDPAASPDAQDARIAELEQQLANARAVRQKTTGAVEPLEPAPEGP